MSKRASVKKQRKTRGGHDLVMYQDNRVVVEGMDAPMPDGMRPCIDYARVGQVVERIHDGRATKMMKERAIEFVHRAVQPLIEDQPDRSHQRWCAYCHDWHDMDRFDVIAGRARGYCRTGYNAYMREYMREYQRELRGSKTRYGVYRSSLSQVTAVSLPNV